jgi:hypothetical protein
LTHRRSPIVCADLLDIKTLDLNARKETPDASTTPQAAKQERDALRDRPERGTARLPEAAYNARRSGLPIRDIVEASGLTKQGLYDVARSHGYDLKRARPPRRKS